MVEIEAHVAKQPKTVGQLSMKATNVLLYTIAFLLVSPVFLFAGSGFLYGWSEDRTFASEGLLALQQTDAILISHGLCPSNRSCSEQGVSIYKMGFPAKEPKGLMVEIFGTQDSKLLGQLSQVFIEEFHKNPDMQHLKIQARAVPKSEYDKDLFGYFRNPYVLNIDMRKAEETNKN